MPHDTQDKDKFSPLFSVVLAMPHGTQDKDKFSPLFSVVGFSFYCALSFISFLMVHIHVVFGLPLFLFPSDVHLKATVVMSSDGLRRT